jgi:hypothetical protein
MKWWISPCKRIYRGETRKCAKHNGELMDISKFLVRNPKCFCCASISKY